MGLIENGLPQELGLADLIEESPFLRGDSNRLSLAGSSS